MKHKKEKYSSITEWFLLIAQIYDTILKIECHKAFTISSCEINRSYHFRDGLCTYPGHYL